MVVDPSVIKSGVSGMWVWCFVRRSVVQALTYVKRSDGLFLSMYLSAHCYIE